MGRESATPQLLDALRACAETAVELRVAQHSPSATQYPPFDLQHSTEALFDVSAT